MKTETSIIKDKPETNVFLFHPTAVIILFILDWGGFVLEIPQILTPLTLIFTSIFLFLVSSVFIYYLQIYFAGEIKHTAFLKAIIGGLICAVPAPLMSTFVGTIILALSGFDAIKNDGLEGIINMFKRVKSE
jgi:hypothetical protein